MSQEVSPFYEWKKKRRGKEVSNWGQLPEMRKMGRPKKIEEEKSLRFTAIAIGRLKSTTVRCKQVFMTT